MNDHCDKAKTAEARQALWIVLVLNALTFAIEITAGPSLLYVLRDAALYGVGLLVIVALLRRKADGLESNRANRCSADVTCDSSVASNCAHC
jgi:hypothetical protein